MSDASIRMRREFRAREDFKDVLQQLKLELSLNMPLRILKVYVRYLEDLVERTGGSELTAAYRVDLCAVKKDIANRGRKPLQLVRNTESN